MEGLDDYKELLSLEDGYGMILSIYPDLSSLYSEYIFSLSFFEEPINSIPSEETQQKKKKTIRNDKIVFVR